jgi:hypothetical protein
MSSDLLHELNANLKHVNITQIQIHFCFECEKFSCDDLKYLD